MPLVSVIMVSHRDTPFVRAAVASVFAQTLRDWELIFVDNGSGMTPESLGESGRDDRLRWIALEQNFGIPIGMNAALKVARGEFIAVLDADDLALPRRFEVQAAFLRANPGLSAVFSAADTIDEAGVVTAREFTLLSERDHRIFSAYDMPAMTPTVMLRRQIMERYPYREDFDVACDYDQMSRIADHHASCALPEVLTQYRRHQIQTTVQKRVSQVFYANIVRLLTARRRSGRDEAMAALVEELREWLAQPPDPATQYAFFARRSLAEGYILLAVYFARKMLADARTPRGIAGAGWILLHAMGQNPGQIVRLLRMFFTGPLRAFDLQPA